MRSSTVSISITLSLSILAALLTADAQPQRHMPLIGVLANDGLAAALANPKSPVSALRHGLREMGYVEGQTIAMEYRPHGEKPAPLATYAAELVQRQVDVLVTFGALPTGPPARPPPPCPLSLRAPPIRLPSGSSPAWHSQGATSPGRQGLAADLWGNSSSCSRRWRPPSRVWP